MATTNRFAKGSGVFTCRICDHRTRSTGRGDNENVTLCAECYDLAVEENHFSDHGGAFYSSAEEMLSIIDAIGKRGSKTEPWDELKRNAEKFLSAVAALDAIPSEPVAPTVAHEVKLAPAPISLAAQSEALEAALHRASSRMIESGGSFAANIGKAYQVADSDNQRKLLAVFPELFDRFAA